MKRRDLFTATAAAAMMALTMSMSAYAGQWQQNETGWWYDNGDGTWPASTWQWIDGDGDGIAEHYYFDADGYLLTNTFTPDNKYVNSTGAEEYNSMVAIQQVTPTNTEVVNTANNSELSGEEIITFLEQFQNPEIKHDVSKYSILMLENGRVKNRRYKSGWQWFRIVPYAGRSFVCALAYDDEGYLYTNTTTPDGYQVNKYGALVIDGEVVMHDTSCKALILEGACYNDGTLILDINNVDAGKINFHDTSSFENYASGLTPFGKLTYNHVWSHANSGNGLGLGRNYCVEHMKNSYPETAGNAKYNLNWN